ncbi:uncharacterized protein LOC144175512 [Haemaphysalis longicornis]
MNIRFILLEQAAPDPPTTYSLICTIQAYHPNGPDIPVEAPPDGVCDFVFYESLYYDGRTDALKGPPLKRVSSFQKLAERSYQTQYGFSIEALSSSFKLHAIVLLGHVRNRDYNIQGCRILPPNVYTIPPSLRGSIKYARPFADTCKVAECLKAKLGNAMPISVSVTMKGRTYKPKTHDPAVSSIGNYGLLNECAQGNYSQEIRPLLICNNATYTPSLAINQTYQAVVAFSKAAGWTLVFDNSNTLLRKVCEAKTNLTNVEFGLSVFDANYDNGTTQCPANYIKGDGDRTGIIKKALHYFRNFTDASKEAGCTSLT